MSAADIERYGANQQKMLVEFSNLAGHNGALFETGDPRWKDVALAGMNYSKLQCERFIGAIFRWHRDGETAKQQLALVGSTTTTVLGLVKTTQEAMAITAAAFGLASGTLTNITNSVLFKVEPSRVRQTVDGLQEAYYNAVLQQTVVSRASVVATIAKYHAMCLPANIEAEVNQKIGNDGSIVAKIPGQDAAPLVATASDVAKMQFVYTEDDLTQVLRNFIFSDAAHTKIIPEKAALVRECLATVGLPQISIGKLTSSPDREARVKTVACLRAKGFLL